MPVNICGHYWLLTSSIIFNSVNSEVNEIATELIMELYIVYIVKLKQIIQPKMGLKPHIKLTKKEVRRDFYKIS